MRTPPLPLPVPCVQAPAHWQRVDFISDLHLDAHEPATFEAWAQHMAHTTANALFILGDLFEVWVGDDNQDPFALQCMAVLKATAQRMPVYFMCGNRDFLVGATLLTATGMQGLNDPTVLDLGPTLRLLLSHGDALCLDDHDYLAFRAQVRQPEWQAAFWPNLWPSDRPMHAALANKAKRANKRTPTTPMSIVLLHAHGSRPAKPTYCYTGTHTNLRCTIWGMA